MMRTRVRNRNSLQGVTLIEALIMSFVALGLVGVSWQILRRAMKIGDASSQSVQLQVGVRNLLQNLTADLARAHQLLSPESGPMANNISLALYADVSAQTRLTLNTSQAYPFSDTSGSTQQKIDVTRVDYIYDPQAQTIIRRAREGILLQTVDGGDIRFLNSFTFQPQGNQAGERQMATSVQAFDIRYVGYHPNDGSLVYTEAPSSGPTAFGVERTACLVVHLSAIYDEGSYGGDDSSPRIEVMTKLWTMKRLNDEMYKEYFSSADEDLRF